MFWAEDFAFELGFKLVWVLLVFTKSKIVYIFYSKVLIIHVHLIYIPTRANITRRIF